MKSTNSKDKESWQERGKQTRTLGMQGPSGHSAPSLSQGRWRSIQTRCGHCQLAAAELRTREQKGLNGKADLSLKEAVVGEGGLSVTGGGEAGPGPSGTKAALAATCPPHGDHERGHRKPKAKTSYIPETRALPEDATTFQYLHMRPQISRGLWRP